VTDSRRDVVVVGAGHNGLVAACYLAKAGLDVEVVERDEVLGGAVSTVERWPGVRVDRGSTLHVMVRHTGIVEELALGEVGLDYIDADPWAVSMHDGAALVFSTDLSETCASIESVCGSRDADAYADFAARWMPRVDAMLRAFHRPPTTASLVRSFWPLGRQLRATGGDLGRDFLQPADHLLDTTFTDERLKTALAWWAAQAGPAPHEVGTAPLVATALLMHRHPPGRPRGGSGALSDALARRLQALGGTLRLGDGATAARCGADGGAVRTVSGDEIRCGAILAACHVLSTLDLLGDDPALRQAREKLRVGSGMGMALRVLTDRLPPYAGDVVGMHSGMQLLASSREQLRGAYADYLRGDAPQDPPLLVMTPTATDASLAPSGRHVVTIWTQWHPRVLRSGGWTEARTRETERLVVAMDRLAPGFASSVVDTYLQTPEDLERELDLRSGNVMHLEMALDAMFALRPLPEWSSHRGPRPGLYLCGASTHPGGGVSGASGRNAAGVLLRDWKRRPNRRVRRRR
jgi:phytoene dehydrogenase-like protein